MSNVVIPDDLMLLIREYVLKVKECDNLRLQIGTLERQNNMYYEMILKYQGEQNNEKK